MLFAGAQKNAGPSRVNYCGFSNNPELVERAKDSVPICFKVFKLPWLGFNNFPFLITPSQPFGGNPILFSAATFTFGVHTTTGGNQRVFPKENFRKTATLTFLRLGTYTAGFFLDCPQGFPASKPFLQLKSLGDTSPWVFFICSLFVINKNAAFGGDHI